jgi:hypothetical protein
MENGVMVNGLDDCEGYEWGGTIRMWIRVVLGLLEEIDGASNRLLARYDRMA